MCNDMKFKNIKEAHMCVIRDFDNLMSVIDSFNGILNHPINKQDLEQFVIGVWYNINDQVKIRRRKHRFKDHPNFDTIIEKGGGFGEHFHSDLIESAEVEYGEVKDLLDGSIYKAGDVMEYDKGVSHEPIALQKTRLHVLFKP